LNYRHAFHAGNFADCFKHALLVWLLRAMARKPSPFLMLDTHAGTGRYDLSADAAERTGEWRRGIARLRDDPPAALADYLAKVSREPGAYPGSPVIAREMLRPGDRLVCCEAHPDDFSDLRALFARDPQTGVHKRDGWEALRAFLPPPEKRALVLIDPPYERPDEFSQVAAGLSSGAARFRSGVFAAWHPVKHRAPVRAFHAALAGLRDVVSVELHLREPLDPAQLNGCGMVVVNPPYRFEAEARPILDALLDRLGDREPGEGVSITRLSDE
jgi:23S rRNA (adenine2030-N6)-methyltransferase